MAHTWLAMGEFDAAHKVKMVADEWGAWHPGPALDPRYLFSYVPSMCDALGTGITLDGFNRHADKAAMCNVAQLVNCVHAPFLALKDHFAATTIFHAFDIYKSHKGGQSLRFVSDAPAILFGANKSFWGLAGVGLAARESARDHDGESARQRAPHRGGKPARRCGPVPAM